MKNYKTYAFDMDLTLLDTIETSNAAYKASIEKVGGVFDKDKVVYMLSTPLTTTYEEIDNPNQPYEVFLKEFVDVARETFLDGSHFYDDASKIIETLYKEDKTLAIVTNRDSKVVKEVLTKAGILHYFKSIITCDKVKNLKPNAEPILKCLEETGSTKEDFVYIGDAKNDWMSACNAGVDFIACERYDNCKFDAKIKVHSLLDIK